MECPKAHMNNKGHTVEFVDTLPEELEEKMRKDLVEYESSHGIDVNFKRFAVILGDEKREVKRAGPAILRFVKEKYFYMLKRTLFWNRKIAGTAPFTAPFT
jgi:hypothetical protein